MVEILKQPNRPFRRQIIKSDIGSIWLFRESLLNLNVNEIGDYLCKYGEKLFHSSRKNVRSEEISHVLNGGNKRLLFFDIETCGLHGIAPIFMISWLGLSESLDISQADVNLVFAPNYSREQTLLEYFFKVMKSYDLFFTYNGKSFDLSRMSRRAVNYGIKLEDLIVNGEKIIGSHRGNLRKILGGRHIDLRKYSERLLETTDKRLPTLEKEIFGYEREEDISGRKIPKIYRDFVYGESNEDKIVSVVQHNIRDVVSLATLATYFCSPKT